MKRWIVYLGGIAALAGIAIALVLGPIGAHSLILMGLYWLWTGALMLLDQLPGRDNGRFDRWEKQVYGLSLGTLGLVWTAYSFTPWPHARMHDVTGWLPALLTLVPSALIAFFGRRWYVEKKRNDAYHKNLTEKD